MIPVAKKNRRRRRQGAIDLFDIKNCPGAQTIKSGALLNIFLAENAELDDAIRFPTSMRQDQGNPE
jgi:hypothetical protein